MAIQKVTSSLIADNAVGLDQLNVTDGTDGQVLKTNGNGALSLLMLLVEEVVLGMLCPAKRYLHQC